MRARRRGDVDGVDLGVVDQLVGIIVPTGDAVSAGVILGLGAVATHDGDDRTAGNFLEGRPAFDLRHVAAANESPADLVHGGPTAMSANSRGLRYRSSDGIAMIKANRPALRLRS